MSARKSRQKVNILRQRISTLLAVMLLLFMSLFFLFRTVSSIVICRNIHADDLMEYSGPYTLTKSHPPRNTVYYATLGNGDVLRITPELLAADCDLGSYSALCFLYSVPQTGFSSAYTCVGISDMERDECYLSVDDAYAEAVGGAWVYGILSTLTLGMLAVMFGLRPKYTG